MPNRFVGYIDTVEPTLAGWVIDRQRPGEPVHFIAIVDRTLRILVVAGLPRRDVAAAGHGNSRCGFNMPLPAQLFDGRAHDIDLVLKGGEKLLLAAWQMPVVLGPVAAAIVPIAGADRDDVAALLHQTYLESGLTPDAITDRYVAQWIGSAMDAGGLLFGARVEERLVGYAMLERCQEKASAIGAGALSVLRLYRRKGIGERLMRALLDAVREGGSIDEVWLSVEPANLPARRLYEKLGFDYREAAPSSLAVPAGYLAMLWRPDRLDG